MKKIPAYKYPLRKVLCIASLPIGTGHDVVSTARAGHEVFECGHVSLPKHDIYGETNATRRRCRYCYEGKPVHVDISKYM